MQALNAAGVFAGGRPAPPISVTPLVSVCNQLLWRDRQHHHCASVESVGIVTGAAVGAVVF